MSYIIFLSVAIHYKPSDAYDRYQQRDSSVGCFVAYLKQQNVNDDFLNSIRILNPITQACLNGVEFEKDQLYAQTKSILQYQDNHICLLETMDNENYKNLLIKMAIVKQRSEGVINKLDRMWTGKKTPKQNAIKRIEKELQDSIDLAKINCNLKIGFEEVFDSFFEVEYEEENFLPYEDVEDFCIKKELMDQQLIDPVKYRIKLYPRNIRVESLDCIKILDPLKKNLIASLYELQSETFFRQKNHCAFKVLKDENEYFYTMLKMEILSKINLSLEEKQKEKIDFVDKMTEISNKINNDCKLLK